MHLWNVFCVRINIIIICVAESVEVVAGARGGGRLAGKGFFGGGVLWSNGWGTSRSEGYYNLMINRISCHNFRISLVSITRHRIALFRYHIALFWHRITIALLVGYDVRRVRYDYLYAILLLRWSIVSSGKQVSIPVTNTLQPNMNQFAGCHFRVF